MVHDPFRPGIALAVSLVVGMVGYLAFRSEGASARPGQGAHESIEAYAGPSTCLSCHRQEARAMFGSVHYRWTGTSAGLTGAGSGQSGTVFNSYCGAVATSRRVTCRSCHAGNGASPGPDPDDEQLANIDCLTCHQDGYRRKPAAPTVRLAYTGPDHITRTWSFPDEDHSGNYRYTPDEPAMAISVLTAARTVRLPTRAACLGCHAYADDSDGGKRGDLSSETAEPPLWAEVHMSPDGGDLTCTACHADGGHGMRGRGLGVTTHDSSECLTCASGGCHPATPHQDSRLNGHTARVACQTCHIPTFAKLRSTEMRRLWLNPQWSQGLFGGQGGFAPESVRAMMVVPTYMWDDGTSRDYLLDQVAPPVNDQGACELDLPNGGVDTPGARIMPMKEHFSNAARHTATGRLIPHSTFIYYVTGDFRRAVQEGQARSGLTGSWDLANIHSYRSINHGVEPASKALACADCHSSLAGGRPVRMDLQGKLGYAPRPGFSCRQCHESPASLSFVALHDAHAGPAKVACVRCHGFSRPPRV